MRTPLIIANWKMNHTVEDTLKFATSLQRNLIIWPQAEIVICPPYTSLYSLSVLISEQPGPKLGAQNCHWEQNGAYTGEISPVFLKELGCEYVILGHSERRHIFGETDEHISKKTKAVLRNEMKPILCVGETNDQRKAGKTFEVVLTQLERALKNLEKEGFHQLTIAYEPVWAIGTGNNATPDQAQEVHEFIREEIQKMTNADMASSLRILYGGSVKPDNMASLMKKPDIDGALVGGASLSVDSFTKIVNYAS